MKGVFEGGRTRWKWLGSRLAAVLSSIGMRRYKRRRLIVSERMLEISLWERSKTGSRRGAEPQLVSRVVQEGTVRVCVVIHPCKLHAGFTVPSVLFASVLYSLFSPSRNLFQLSRSCSRWSNFAAVYNNRQCRKKLQQGVRRCVADQTWPSRTEQVCAKPPDAVVFGTQLWMMSMTIFWQQGLGRELLASRHGGP